MKRFLFVPHYLIGVFTPMSPVEQSLLVAITEGDACAFWTLWESVAGALFALCLREMRGNRADAEDALEQAMMKALAKLPLFALKIVSPQAWLFRVASNVCNDIYRERARLARVTAHLEVLATPSADVDDGDGGCATEPEPAGLIASLPHRLREVFVLRVIQQMPYKEIAARLDLTSAAARKRVQQARSVLRASRDRGDVRPPDCGAAAERRPMPPVARVVRVRLPSGRESELEIVVDTTPSRVRRKIVTLRVYVRRHPHGWKMHLRLADLLYATGAWTEAAECYELVLQKRPSLTAAAARLETIRGYPTTTTV